MSDNDDNRKMWIEGGHYGSTNLNLKLEYETTTDPFWLRATLFQTRQIGFNRR
ncbi:hypothetical protein J2X61_001250 [Bacillus sp. 3255]|nr:hypothetical protein [Bacillus sp. 3255]